VLAGMEEIDDLNGSRKVVFGDVPDPFCAIADDDFLFGAGPAALPCFNVETPAELLGVLNGAGIGGGLTEPLARRTLRAAYNLRQVCGFISSDRRHSLNPAIQPVVWPAREPFQSIGCRFLFQEGVVNQKTDRIF
jgi:hypothetical protein